MAWNVTMVIIIIVIECYYGDNNYCNVRINRNFAPNIMFENNTSIFVLIIS